MNTKSNSIIRCWSCDGTGIDSPAACNTARVDITCARCKGAGKCSEVMLEWEDLGRRIRKVRQGRDQSIREWAQQLGVSASTLSKAERGIIDPHSLPSGNDEMRDRHLEQTPPEKETPK
jgi:DNA-binding XRE family transcriptional regulator